MFDLIEAEDLAQGGSIVVVTPHPIDEVLGCGGVIAEAARLGLPLHVIMLTASAAADDPSSPASMREIRGADDVRRAETLTAIHRLGGSGTMVSFLDLPGGGLAAGGLAFGIAVDIVAAALRQHRAGTLLAPWHADPHPDHLAASHIAKAACEAVSMRPRRLAYAIWAWAKPEAALPDDGIAIDVGAHTLRRLWALEAHASQIATMRSHSSVAVVPDHLRRLVERPVECYFGPEE